MELRARILLIISISSLILYLSVEGLNIPPSVAQPNSKLDGVNKLEKDQVSPILDEPKEASSCSLGPIPARVSPTVLDEAKQALSPFFAPVMSSIVNKAEALSSSIFGLGPEASSLVPSPFSGPVPYPKLPSSSSGTNPAPSSFSGPVTYPNPPSPSPGLGLGPGPTPYTFSGPVHYPNRPSSSPGSGLGPGPRLAPFGFFDHDVALAIEARIKRSQSDAQLAMDEAKKLLNDSSIASSETGKCLSKCVDKYGASLNGLNRAIMYLGVRDVTLLAKDFGAVETDISMCQACFKENIGEDSPLKALEEATSKAARECLTVMDYAA